MFRILTSVAPALGSSLHGNRFRNLHCRGVEMSDYFQHAGCPFRGAGVNALDAPFEIVL